MDNTVVPSNLVSPELEASADELWDLGALFLANWVDSVRVHTAYVTDISEAKTGDESRIGLIGRPYRTLSFRVLSWGGEEVQMLNALATRSGIARSMVPLYCDLTHTTQANPTNTVYCDTRNRRFYIGARVILACLPDIPYWAAATTYAPGDQVQYGGKCYLSRLTGTSATTPAADAANWRLIPPPTTLQHHIGVVEEVHDDRLVLSAILTESYPVGSVVLPLIECEVNLSSDLDILTDSGSEGTLEFREITGKSALPPLTEPGTLLSPSHGGIPVLTLPLQWGKLRSGSARTGKITSIGLGNVAEVYNDRAKATRTLQFLQLNRTEAFDLLRFFDSRGGRNYPLWVPSPDNDYFVTKYDSASAIRVRASGPFYDWAFRPHIFFLDVAGNYQIRTVTPVERIGGEDYLSLDTALNLSVTFEKVGLCLLCRFDTDEIEENWITDAVMDASLPVIEVLNERPLPVEVPEYGGSDYDPCVVSGEDHEGGDAGGPDDGDDEDVPGHLLYMQGWNCRTEAYANAWLPVNQLPETLPVTVRPAGTAGPDGVIASLTDCFTFNTGNPVSRTAGHRLIEYTVLTDCTECSPTSWVGTRKCSDDSEYTIYQASNSARLLTGTFLDKFSGVCFYFDPLLMVSSLPAEAQQAVRIEPVPDCSDVRCTQQWEQAYLCGYDTAYPMWQRTDSAQKMAGTWFDVLRGRCFYWPETPVIVAHPGQIADAYNHIFPITDCTDPLCAAFDGAVCSQVSDGPAPSEVVVTLSDTSSAADGSFDLVQDTDPCQWTLTSGTLTVTATRTSVSLWTVTAIDDGTTLFSGTLTVPSTWANVSGIPNTEGTGTAALTLTQIVIAEGADPCDGGGGSGELLDCGGCQFYSKGTVSLARPTITINKEADYFINMLDPAYQFILPELAAWFNALPASLPCETYSPYTWLWRNVTLHEFNTGVGIWDFSVYAYPFYDCTTNQWSLSMVVSAAGPGLTGSGWVLSASYSSSACSGGSGVTWSILSADFTSVSGGGTISVD